MSGIDNGYLKDHRLFRSRNKKIIAAFPIIALIVAIIVFWCLKIIGITVTSDTLCDLQEHTHISSCYSDGELVCLKPEHTHSSECFPDRTVDMETTADWLKTIENVKITNDVAQNLVSVASTQVGYKESDRNYKFDAHAQKLCYTRYGEWYGNPYGEWNTMFVSFCLNYSNINGVDSLQSGSAESMRRAWQNKLIYSSAENYDGTRGDIAFFDTDSDGKADRSGIVIYKTEKVFIVIEGDSEGAVKSVVYDNDDKVIGYGKTSELYAAEHITVTDDNQSGAATLKPTLEGKLIRYIPNSPTPTTYNLRRTTSQGGSVPQTVYDSEPLVMMAAANQNITYTSDLTGEVVEAIFKDLNGNVITNGSTIYIGQSYVISLEFSEINSGNKWVQFKHDANGVLTYQIPSNLHCDRFDTWHKISAKTENGTIEDVGEYFVDENGLLQVRFYEDANGVNFVDKYANVDFTIEFSATVDTTQSGDSTDIDFNDDIKINFDVDGNAGIQVTKTHGEFNKDDNTVEYTIRVDATHGLVKDLIIDDQIWENHYALRDTIVVTDLDGNPIVPQPTVSDHPNQFANSGFRLSGFPDFSAGEGFLITYKSTPYENLLSNDFVDMWNGIDAYAKNPGGGDIYTWAEDWTRIELTKIEKDGKMAVLTDAQGNKIPVIEWGVGIRKTAEDLQGTVIIDTLGEGLAYYTAQPILIKRYDQWGNKLPDSYLSWDDVTITNTDGKTSMQFPLPSGYAFDLIYYTTFPPLDEGETATHTNRVEAIINTKPEGTEGSADVIGFVPHVDKRASGNDGEYVYFEIEADVSSAIKDWGHFYLTDLAAFWGYNNAEGYLYVENVPQNLVITATTESGQVITFTPYVQGGPVENTYILVAPADGNQFHSFNILFNTADATFESSKWTLNEDATLKITYKLPFDSGTGTEWVGELKGDKTLEDVLLEGYRFSNEVYFNFTQAIQGVAGSQYEYSPMLSKKGYVNDDGTIDYTVVFNNSIPGSNGNDGYLESQIYNVIFHDTFDEKLEYVPGSLMVTCYSPWDKSIWFAKYKYDGNITGNTFNVPAEDFKFYENHTGVGWDWLANAKTLREYYEQVNAGGRYVFTYQLKVKDEYLTTTDHSKYQLDNTAELTWSPNNTSGPANETVEFETGLLDKSVAQDDSKLMFGIHVNRGALDILEGSDTLTIEDTMTDNLSVYWDSIKLEYEDENKNWVDFDSQQSKYTYTITYDPASNKLTFVVPDELHIRIDYTTLVTESGYVSVKNSIVVDGKAEVTDMVDAIFRVDEHSGDASGSNQKITLIKQDGITNLPLQGAKFMLFGPMGDSSAQLPQGVYNRTITTEDGIVLSYIGTYETDEHGICNIETQYLTQGDLFAFVELVAPEGYELLTSPVYFYFYATDPSGNIQSVTTLIAIENFSGVPLVPETGSMGIYYTAIIGSALVAFPILYSSIRRKRQRGL